VRGLVVEAEQRPGPVPTVPDVLLLQHARQVCVAVFDVDGAAALAYAVGEDLHQPGGAFPD
jgi:hypothetical protein